MGDWNERCAFEGYRWLETIDAWNVNARTIRSDGKRRQQESRYRLVLSQLRR